MTGTGFLALVLVSMAWLLFLAGFALKVRPLSGIEVPWPWVWILLPLVLLMRKR
jgi:hypothetical protein